MPSEEDANLCNVNNEKVRANGGWITNEFIHGVIRQLEGDEDVLVVDRKVTAAVGVGDNYMSIMYQIAVELARGGSEEREHRQFLVKSLPSAEILRTVVQEYGIFRKELYLYNFCLPVMRAFAEEYVLDQPDFIAARSYKCSLPDVLVLEDLKLSGYKMANRRELLDYEHMAVTLRSLARFHALSVKLVTAKPEVIDVVTRDEFYSPENKSKLYNHVFKAVDTWKRMMKDDEKLSKYMPEIEKATEKVLDKMVHVVSKRDGSFVCLNHGDSWTNNFMYRHDETGIVRHAKLVDFQLVRYSSPALDLLYFIASSCQPEILSERFSDLIRMYHEALVSDLEKLRIDSCKYPTLDDIHRELKYRSIFGITSFMILTPIVVSKPCDTADFESITMEEMENSQDYFLDKNFKDEFYRELVLKYIKFFRRMGYIESAQELVVDNFGGE